MEETAVADSRAVRAFQPVMEGWRSRLRLSGLPFRPSQAVNLL